MLWSCIWENFHSQRHLWVNIKHAGKKELCNTNLRKPWSLCYHHVSQISLSTSWMKVFYYIVCTKYITTSFTKIATNRWRCPQQFSQMQDRSHFWMTWINFLKQASKLQLNDICWRNNLHIKYRRIMCEIKIMVYCDLEDTVLKNSGQE